MLVQTRIAIAETSQPPGDEWETIGTSVDLIAEQYGVPVDRVWGALFDLERELLVESGCSSLVAAVSCASALSSLGDRIARRLAKDFWAQFHFAPRDQITQH